MSEEGTIGEDIGEATKKGSATKTLWQPVWLYSHVFLLRAEAAVKCKSRAEGAVFSVSLRVPPGLSYRPSVTPSTHTLSLVTSLKLARLALGGADEVVLSIINREKKTKQSEHANRFWLFLENVIAKHFHEGMPLKLCRGLNHHFTMI